EQRVEVLVHQAGDVVASGGRLNGLYDVLWVEQLAADHLPEALRDLVLALVKQALEHEWADLSGLCWFEDQLQGQPVGGVADEEASQREHPPRGVNQPQR